MPTGRGHRSHALASVTPSPSIEEALADVAARHGGNRPIAVATSARRHAAPATVGYTDLRRIISAQPDRPVALLFGTGHGLPDWVIAQAEWLLPPISGHGPWNHLSVRSAAAVVLDRLFGTGA